jgi:plasmid stabilization system protein ParE
MIPVELSEAADADLVEILSYGVDVFGEALDLISRHPLAGAVHDTVRPPIRSLPHGSHRLFYDVFEDRGGPAGAPQGGGRGAASVSAAERHIVPDFPDFLTESKKERII